MAIQTDKLTISVMNPETTIYEGEVLSFSSVNIFGKFDVLPLHTNFISIIKDSIVIKEMGGKEKHIKIEEGILKVYENKLYVFLGIEAIREEQKKLR